MVELDGLVEIPLTAVSHQMKGFKYGAQLSQMMEMTTMMFPLVN